MISKTIYQISFNPGGGGRVQHHIDSTRIAENSRTFNPCLQGPISPTAGNVFGLENTLNS